MNNDQPLQNYQDDLDADNDATDPIMDEETDDPTEELGVPPEELEAELSDLDIDYGNNTPEGEDAREQMEDADEETRQDH